MKFINNILISLVVIGAFAQSTLNEAYTKIKNTIVKQLKTKI